MKRLLLAAALGGVALVVGGSSGLATIWLAGGTALAAGFGWVLGGLPAGWGGVGADFASDGPVGDGDSGGGDGGGGGE